MGLLRDRPVQDDFVLSRVLDGNLDGVAVFHLNHVLAQDDLRALCGICGFNGDIRCLRRIIGFDRVGACDLNGIGFLQNAIADGHDNAIAEQGGCFFCVRQLVKRETVFVVLRKENRIARKCRRKCATDHVRERAFLAGVQVFFNQVENVISVACENNLIVVDPVDIAFVIACGTYDFEVCTVCVNHRNATLLVVKETECDAFPIRAELGTVNIIVEQRSVRLENVNGFFGGGVLQIAIERNLAQYESCAERLASHEYNCGALFIE